MGSCAESCMTCLFWGESEEGNEREADKRNGIYRFCRGMPTNSFGSPTGATELAIVSDSETSPAEFSTRAEFYCAAYKRLKEPR